MSFLLPLATSTKQDSSEWGVGGIVAGDVSKKGAPPEDSRSNEERQPRPFDLRAFAQPFALCHPRLTPVYSANPIQVVRTSAQIALPQGQPTLSAHDRLLSRGGVTVAVVCVCAGTRLPIRSCGRMKGLMGEQAGGSRWWRRRGWCGRAEVSCLLLLERKTHAPGSADQRHLKPEHPT